MKITVPVFVGHSNNYEYCTEENIFYGSPAAKKRPDLPTVLYCTLFCYTTENSCYVYLKTDWHHPTFSSASASPRSLSRTSKQLTRDALSRALPLSLSLSLPFPFLSFSSNQKKLNLIMSRNLYTQLVFLAHIAKDQARGGGGGGVLLLEGEHHHKQMF